MSESWILDDAARARTRQHREVDAALGRDAAGERRRAHGHRRGLRDLDGALGRAGVRIEQQGDHAPDRHLVAGRSRDAAEDTGPGGVDLDRGLVGLDLHQGLAGGHIVTRLLQPAHEPRTLLTGLQRGHDDLDRHG
jgi:hypothetical protein